MSDTAPAGARGNNAAPAGARGDNVDGHTRQVRHSERLYVPWWHWPLPLLAAALLAAEVHMGYSGIRSWLPYVLLLPLALFLLAWTGRARVRLITGENGDSELVVADARLPVRYAGEVDVLTGPDKRVALGRELDPEAYVLHRGWIPTAVRVHLTDPDDPTPYWVFSTRSPERLATLLREAAATRPASGQHDTPPGT